MIQMQPTMARARDQLKPPETSQPTGPVLPPPAMSSIERARSLENRSRGRRSRIIKRRPFVLAVAQWLAKWVNAGRPQVLTRTKRLLWWMAYNGHQVYAMLRTLIGGRVDAQKFSARMVACEDCPSLQKRLVRKRPFVKLYCGSCGCPQWWLSELGPIRSEHKGRRFLRYKNQLLKWECPLDKHERLDDPPEWAGIIEEDRLWTAETSSEDEAVVVGMPADRQGFGEPKRPCGGGR